MAEGTVGWSGWLLNAAYASGTLCAGALMLLYIYQDRLLYFPTIPGASKLTRDNPQGAFVWSSRGKKDLWLAHRFNGAVLISYVYVRICVYCYCFVSWL